MSGKRPLILVGNDDSIHARGIHYLIDFISEFGDIVVCAPETHQSGMSSAITCTRVLQLREYPDYNGAKMYSVDGTPVDAIKVAANCLLHNKPDFVITGINHGPNYGNSALYSGTMGAAFEGAVMDIPSIGFSFLAMDEDADMSACRQTVQMLMRKALNGEIEKGICLNVNIPDTAKVIGTKVVRPAKGYWDEEFKEGVIIDGHRTFALTGEYINLEPERTDTDLAVIAQGYASITPLRPDQTAVNRLEHYAKLLDSTL